MQIFFLPPGVPYLLALWWLCVSSELVISCLLCLFGGNLRRSWAGGCQAPIPLSCSLPSCIVITLCFIWVGYILSSMSIWGGLMRGWASGGEGLKFLAPSILFFTFLHCDNRVSSELAISCLLYPTPTHPNPPPHPSPPYPHCTPPHPTPSLPSCIVMTLCFIWVGYFLSSMPRWLQETKQNNEI